MKKTKYHPPRLRTDKLCFLVLAALWFGTGLADMALDEAALRTAEADQLPAVEITWEAPMDQPRLLEAITLQLERSPYRENIPLDQALQVVLLETCEEYGVPVPLALGLIEVESGFDPEADNGLCYGLCQLNKRYYPDFLAPEDNIRCGVAHLAGLLEQYGDAAAALTAYNAGYDTGSRTYADAVLAAAKRWED